MLSLRLSIVLLSVYNIVGIVDVADDRGMVSLVALLMARVLSFGFSCGCLCCW